MPLTPPHSGFDWIASAVTLSGEANTASNLGAGSGLFSAKVGVDLRFKSLVAGTNVTLSSDSNTVTINAAGGGSTAWGSITGTLSAQTDLQTALNGKEGTIPAGTTLQYYRGDKTFQTLNTAAVPELTNLYYTEGRVSANSDVAANTAVRHAAATIGTANGLSLFGQQLSLSLATTSLNGALSSADWNTFNGKQALLVSGTNIKTINGTTLLGSGDITAGGETNTVSNIGGGFFLYHQKVGVNFELKTLLAGTGISMTQSASAITINSTGGGVTSVSGTVNRISSTGGATPVIDIDAAYVGQASITTLGTIGTGTWNATTIADNKIAAALTGKSINGVTLATGGSATLFLNQQGNYVSATGGSGADPLGTYLVKTATNAPANAQVMGSLATGLVKNTTTTGVQSIAVAGTDYLTPTGSAASLTSFPTFNQNTTGSAVSLSAILSPTWGGTGINNATRTITINTNNAAFTFPTAATTMTMPSSSATLARTDAGQTFTGTNTFDSNTVVNGVTLSSSGSAGLFLTQAGTYVAAGGSGTVTSVTSVNADLTVATQTTTPVITLVQTPALRSATTTVNVAASAAPVAGQVLKATSSTAAVWDYIQNNNSNTASLTGFAVDTYLTGSNIIFPSTPVVSTTYRLTFDVTKTAAGTAATVINVRFGTNGTIADTARVTFTMGVGTAAIDTGIYEITCTFRSVGSVNAVLVGILALTSNLTTTGLSNGVKARAIGSSVFDSTVANSQIGVSYNGGASAAHTIQLVRAELFL